MATRDKTLEQLKIYMGTKGVRVLTHERTKGGHMRLSFETAAGQRGTVFTGSTPGDCNVNRTIMRAVTCALHAAGARAEASPAG